MSNDIRDDSVPSTTEDRPVEKPLATRRSFMKAGSAVAATAAAAAGTLLPLTAGAARSAKPRGNGYDVVVVGGGFAGVTAARELALRGLRVQVLEARDRLGGRTFYSRFGDTKVELGGTWVHWTQPHVWAEVMRYGMELVETPGSATPDRVMWLSGGKVQEPPLDESMRLLSEAASKFHEGADKAYARAYTPLLTSEGERLDQLSIRDRIEQLRLPQAQRDLLAGLMATNCHNAVSEGAFAEMLRWWTLADRDVVRLLDTCARYKLKTGTSSLIRKMVEDGGFDVRLSTVVSAVVQSGAAVTVVTEQDERIPARHVVMAVPVNTLSAIDFKPALLPGKIAVSRQKHAGAGHKVYLKVQGELGSVLAMAPETEPLTMFFTDHAGKDEGVLLGFGTPANGRFDVNNPKAYEPLVRKFLPHITVTEVLSYDWRVDPYSQGTWCTLKPGQLSRHGRDLMSDEGKVHFAGADIATGWRGFIDGAIETGLEVAQRVHSALRPKA
jgi:monoamine oxidase